jgi:polyisoprenoid-binding protein YceI
MNNKLSITYFILIFASLLFGCDTPVKEENKNTATANPISIHVGDEKYVAIDTKESIVTWKGSMQIGSDYHFGYVYTSKGELMIENGELIGGAVEVNMNTLEDDKHKSDNNLIDHLKGTDFFDVKKFPIATIEITKVKSMNMEDKEIAGNLTIKGITHPVVFPAQIEMKNGNIIANGKLIIDRTKWGIRYESGKFYDNLANKAIADSVEFNIKIVAKK